MPPAEPESVELPVRAKRRKERIVAADDGNPLVVSLCGTGFLQIEGRYFTDESGRSVWLRGVNLSGNSKLPYNPYTPSHESRDFFNHRDVSFVNRPFPLEEADEHFLRLRHWGFTFLRFNVAWEAIEHAGPGVYDEEYLDYVIKVLLKAKEHGFRCYIDPHQDMWSRFSGGSGAPGWTFEVAGLDPSHFMQTGAAIVHNTSSEPAKYPRMIWNTNVWKLAAGTMYILFFGGDTFAPLLKVDGIPIQEYLQSHFMKAFAALITRVVSTPGLPDSVVLGYDTFNEPMGSWIGKRNLAKNGGQDEVKNGFAPTAFQAMMLGEGIACDVSYYVLTNLGPQYVGKRTIDPQGIRAWSNSRQCIWAQHKVWDKATRQLLKPDYFHFHPVTHQPMEFARDFWRPFVREFENVVRAIHTTAMLFVEPSPFHLPPKWIPEDGDPVDRIVFAPHWYDGFTLVTKTFNDWVSPDLIGVLRNAYFHEVGALKWGERAIRQSFREQLDVIRNEGLELFGEYPCIMGEFGIPFDMSNKYAYKTGDYSMQIKAMDANMYAVETNLLHSTIWNYCPDNTHAWGDGWNGEDLSIWTRPVPSSEEEMKKSTSPLLKDETMLSKMEEVDNESGVMRRRGSARKVDDGDMEELTNDPYEMRSTDKSYAQTIRSPPTTDLITPVATVIGPTSSPRTIPEDLDAGGRALSALIRPYPILTPGEPIQCSFDMLRGLFVFTFRHPTPDGISAFLAEEYLREATLIRFGWPSSDEVSNTISLKAPKINEVNEKPKRSKSTRRKSTATLEDTRSKLTKLKEQVNKLEVEVYLPRIQFPTLEAIEIWTSDDLENYRPNLSNGTGGDENETSECPSDWRIDMEQQRLYWRCPCCVHLLKRIEVAEAELDTLESEARARKSVAEANGSYSKSRSKSRSRSRHSLSGNEDDEELRKSVEKVKKRNEEDLASMYLYPPEAEHTILIRRKPVNEEAPNRDLGTTSNNPAPAPPNRKELSVVGAELLEKRRKKLQAGRGAAMAGMGRIVVDEEEVRCCGMPCSIL
ncbi:glycoside hydrolase superfamily [Cladochytrium replicatum]|nr:glycoside hydrolase superfamily [Cladochytrium replicatum]